ncbi:MAG TPA: hypothetical protein DHW14_05985 [Clostridiales bacterium]|nr:hypothetical protein [Clostridiales bacterium]
MTEAHRVHRHQPVRMLRPRPVPRPGRGAPGSRRHGLPRTVRLVFTLVFIYLIVGFAFQQVVVFRLADQVRELERRAEEIREFNEQLRARIDHAKTDEYIIEVAREKLGLVWPNEVPYTTGGGSGP